MMNKTYALVDETRLQFIASLYVLSSSSISASLAAAGDVSPLELVRRNIDTSQLQRLHDTWLDSPDAIAADCRASARFTRVFLKLFSSEGFASPVLVAAPKSLSVTQRMHFRFENTSAAAAPRAPHSLTACAASC